MVFFFKSTATDPPTALYMGRDKYENEELLRHGYEEGDVWFHVDKLSSAHVYIRMSETPWTLETLPAKLIEDCAQLVKANSIEGNKQNPVTVIYTPWTNLRKTQAMDIGEIGFHSQGAVKRIQVERRNNDIVNRLNKTKEERDINFEKEKIDRQRQNRERTKLEETKKQDQVRRDAEKRRKEDALLHYEDIFDSKNLSMPTNKDNAGMSIEDYENSFM